VPSAPRTTRIGSPATSPVQVLAGCGDLVDPADELPRLAPHAAALELGDPRIGVPGAGDRPGALERRAVVEVGKDVVEGCHGAALAEDDPPWQRIAWIAGSFAVCVQDVPSPNPPPRRGRLLERHRHADDVSGRGGSRSGRRTTPRASTTPAARASARARTPTLEARLAYVNPGGMWMPQQMRLPVHVDAFAKLGVKMEAKSLVDPLAAPLAAVVSLGGCTASFVSGRRPRRDEPSLRPGRAQPDSTKEDTSSRTASSRRRAPTSARPGRRSGSTSRRRSRT